MNSIVDLMRHWCLNSAAHLTALQPSKDSVDIFIHQLIADVLSQLDRMEVEVIIFRQNDVASQNSQVFEDSDKICVLYKRVCLLSLFKTS